MDALRKEDGHNDSAKSILDLSAIERGIVSETPYPHLIATGALPQSVAVMLAQDFPAIDRPGFFPASLFPRAGSFDRLLRDLESPALAATLTRKLGIELRDKPQMITIRKWSAIEDGRIHNDGEAKIATSLLYLNEHWQEGAAGSLRVLRSETDFDDMAAEISPIYGSFFAFKRTENSWHGHKPFAGERRVVQITWLRSWDDFYRKQKRGKFSWVLKKLLLSRKTDGDY
jgi:SM-20-related protein